VRDAIAHLQHCGAIVLPGRVPREPATPTRYAPGPVTLRELRVRSTSLPEATSASPTARFVWGHVGHFLAHVERGTAMRLSTRASAILAPLSPPPATDTYVGLERITADIEKLFGPTWNGKK
jgi:hypothetical protein